MLWTYLLSWTCFLRFLTDLSSFNLSRSHPKHYSRRSSVGYHIHHFHQPSLIVPTQTHTFNYLDLNNQLDMHHSHHGLASAMPTHPAPVAFSSHPALHNQAIISPHISPHNLQAHPHNIMISPNILTSPTGLLPSDALRPHLTSQTLIPVHPTAQPLPIAHASSHGVLTMSNSPPFFTSTPATLKPILHTGGKHHKTKKRSGAKATIDDQCLMTNHQIEDQLWYLLSFSLFLWANFGSANQAKQANCLVGLQNLQRHSCCSIIVVSTCSVRIK